MAVYHSVREFKQAREAAAAICKRLNATVEIAYDHPTRSWNAWLLDISDYTTSVGLPSQGRTPGEAVRNLLTINSESENQS